MLIDFTVENYLSFKESTFFTMQTGSRLKKYKDTHVISSENVEVLKSALVFGPNGSGKSNLFYALIHLKRMILNLGDPKKVAKKIPRSPFKMTEKDSSKPTMFEINLLIDDTIYTYTVKFDDERIIHEKLISLEKTKEILFFERTDDGDMDIVQYGDSKRVNEELFEFTRRNNLFLSVLASFNNYDALKIVDWFQNKLIFINDDAMDLEDDPLAEKLLNPEFKEEVLSLLRIADFNIVDIEVDKEVVKTPVPLLNFVKEHFEFSKLEPERIVYDIKLSYNKYNEEGSVSGTSKISLFSDSRGTGKMLYIAAVIVDSYKEARTILMDEFDTAFHLTISEFLLTLFNSRKNPNNQFIMNSHELELLDCKLRVDQIWFTQKDFTNQTSLYSLFDFNDINNRKRNDISYAKRYMKGVFGAKPVIDYISAENYFNEDSRVFGGSEENQING